MVRRQHWVVARRDLEALGFSGMAIDHRVSTGRLHLVARGVYAVGRPELTQEGCWMAAVLACRGDAPDDGFAAVLSHRSAAELWGIGYEEHGRIDVTIRRRSRLERKGLKVHTRPSLGAGSLTHPAASRSPTPSRP